MNKPLIGFLAFTLSSLVTTPVVLAHSDVHPPAAEAAAGVPAPRLQATLRQLWQGHVQQTRAYAFAIQAQHADQATQAAEGVVANAKQIAGAVAQFYGDPAGAAMLQLLAGHWGAVKAYTDAGFAHDSAAQEKAMADLTANAGEIAKFLAGANPNLPEDALRGLLMAHGTHHAAQIGDIMRGDLAAEKTVWVAMQAHMDSIADALAGAIAKQFPDRVS